MVRGATCRRLAALFAVSWLAGCGDEAPSPTPAGRAHPPDRASSASQGQQPVASDGECGARYVATTGNISTVKDAAVRLAISGAPEDLAHATEKGEFWRVETGGGVVPSLLMSEGGARLAIDDEFVYDAECSKGGCREHGDNQRIIRESRKSGRVATLTDKLGIVVALAIDDTYLYWGEWENDWPGPGAVGRVPRQGGKAKILWRGGPVEQMILDGERIYAATATEVVSIPTSGGRALTLAGELTRGKAIALDADHVYIADEGDPGMNSAASGRVLRVPRSGGQVEQLLGPVRWPGALALVGDRICVGLQNGDIVSIPKDGGPPVTLVKNERDRTCGATRWILSRGRALFWLRTGSMDDQAVLWRLDLGPEPT